MATQMTTYRAVPSPAHSRLSTYDTVREHYKRGYRLMDRSSHPDALGDRYVLWHPESFTTVVIYTEKT